MTTGKRLTVEQAERVVQEAEFLMGVPRDFRDLTSGVVYCHRHTDPETKESLGTASVELKLPGSLGPQFWFNTRDEWRRFKAHYDELAQISDEAVEAGWRVERTVKKAGKVTMYIEVHPPGKTAEYLRIGGMRTWHAALRQHTPIEGTVEEDTRTLAQN